jgi:hypothetical protein
VSHAKPTARTTKREAICKRCGSTDIGVIGRGKEDSHGKRQPETGTDPGTTKN